MEKTLNKQYTEVMKDLMTAAIPFIKSIGSDEEDNKYLPLVSVAYKAIAFGGDMCDVIDDMSKTIDDMSKNIYNMEIVIEQNRDVIRSMQETIEQNHELIKSMQTKVDDKMILI